MNVEIEIIIYVGLLIVGISVLLFIHVCVVGRAFRGEFNHTISSGMDRIPSMRPEDIAELPSFEYKGEGEEKGNGECAVCLENLKAGEKCRMLPNCNHSFHAECIDSWLVKTAACPICRTGTMSMEESSSFSGEGVELI